MKKYIIILFIYIISNLLFFYSNNYIKTLNFTFSYPTEYTDISSFFGYRELYGVSSYHNGVDFLAPLGSNIYACESGFVEYASFLQDGFGNTIILSHDFGYSSMYCHISETFLVNVGDYVQKGELIGYVGPKYLTNGIQNGNTTGPHLHFSILRNNSYIDPLSVL